MPHTGTHDEHRQCMSIRTKDSDLQSIHDVAKALGDAKEKGEFGRERWQHTLTAELRQNLYAFVAQTNSANAKEAEAVACLQEVKDSWRQLYFSTARIDQGYVFQLERSDR